ncbi:winged helix-turn-helix domain-containing protein [Micromonospora echinaurantiaca]|uniref:winged helix-turn-helix domain-containing protein n=1 Tax=Micromonospora echinaurantiaca TaxID=47857 RepID=UPI0037B7DBDA
MTHPRHQLDAVIHNPTRFSIMAALLPADRVEFKFVRDAVEVTDSVLSQHMTALEQVGYVKITKGQVGRRPRTWLSATPAGRAAFHAHLAILNQLANWSPGAEQGGAST